ncbi:MAG: PAS domain-containing sensor histidine kinase [Gammaproteobacteria bacterium]|nr:PAS domain-containing sensor histidine kinase [Gammaproteobacteria bacterium]
MTTQTSCYSQHLNNVGEERFRTLFQSHVAGMIVGDIEGNITDANQTFLKMVGYQHTDLPLRWDKMTPPQWYSMDEKKIEEFLTTGQTAMWEKEYWHKHGHPIPIMVGVARLPGTEIEWVGITIDLTEKKHAEKRLIEQQKQLRTLTSKLSLAEQHERRRIATGLHDNVGQTLAMIKVKLGQLSQSITDTEAKNSIGDIRDLVNDAIDSTRTLTFELSSSLLYELGLEEALHQLSEHIQDHYGIQFDFKGDDAAKPLSEDERLVLYQASTELMFNIAKHSHADNATVSIRRVNSNIEISIADNGKGFKESRNPCGFNGSGGYGLFNVNERLRHIDADFEIKSKPGQGTQATIRAALTISH